MDIKLSELLSFFNLKIELPDYLYDICRVPPSLKEPDYTSFDEDHYKFVKNSTTLVITPNNPEELVKLTCENDYRKTGVIYSKTQAIRIN